MAPSDSCILLLTMGVINFTCLVIFSAHESYMARFSNKMVTAKLQETYHTGPTHLTSTVASVFEEKLREIYQDLNVSIAQTNRIVYPADAIGGYGMFNPALCRGPDVVDFIIIVHTSPDHLERRRRIRETFAREATFLPFHVRVAFLLGRTANLTLEGLLFSEHAAHGDSVMGDFLDDYHNLTLKGVMGYRWVSQHCNNSRFVLKIDDDVMVNTFKLLYSFYGRMRPTRSIFCNNWKANTMSILREGKWNVPRNIFGTRQSFPYSYCSGFVVLISTDLAGPMYRAAKSTPFFWIDDVYLFGILPYVVGGVTFHNYALGENLSLSERSTKTCLQSQGPRCSILASLVSDVSYWSLWDIIKDMYLSNPWSLATQYVA